MISMLCLGNVTSASMLPCIPSIPSNSKRTNLQFSFGHSFTSRSNVHPRQRALNIGCPVIEGSPILRRNGKNDNGSARKMHATNGEATDVLDPLPENPSGEEVSAKKRDAVQLLKDGKAKEVEEFFKNEYEKNRDKPEPAHNVEMALVEILIRVGKYKEALDRNCLKESQREGSDSRFPLYKAIIHAMLGKTEEEKAIAINYWEEYMELLEGGFPSSIPDDNKFNNS